MKTFTRSQIDSISIKDLRESGNYDEDLLNAVENKKFKEISKFSTEHQRDNLDYMEPLLYAVWNDLGTLEVYSHYGESIKKDIDMELVSEMIKKEPELIKNTPISRNRDLLKDKVSLNPRVIKYIDKQLKSDESFLKEISSLNDSRISAEIARSCNIEAAILGNPSLQNDMSFMSIAIIADVTLIEHASDDLINDIIEYATNNLENFGLEEIKGLNEVSREWTVNKSMNIINEMAEKGEDQRYAKVRDKVENGRDKDGKYDIRTMRWTTAMAAQKDDVDLNLVNRVLNYSILTMERIKRDVTETDQMKINIDNMQQLITPLIINKLIDKAKSQGFELDIGMQDRLDAYKEFYEEYNKLFKEEESKKRITTEEIREGVSPELYNSEIDEAARVVDAGIKGLEDREFAKD